MHLNSFEIRTPTLPVSGHVSRPTFVQSKVIDAVNNAMKIESQICGVKIIKYIEAGDVYLISEKNFEAAFPGRKTGVKCCHGYIFCKESLPIGNFICDYISAAVQWFSPLTIMCSEDKIISSGIQSRTPKVRSKEYRLRALNKAIIEILAADIHKRIVSEISSLKDVKNKRIYFGRLDCPPKRELLVFMNSFIQFVQIINIRHLSSIERSLKIAFLNGKSHLIQNLCGSDHYKFFETIHDDDQSIKSAIARMCYTNSPALV